MTNRVSPIFTTLDRASQSFAPPFVAPHEGVAIRGFQDAINNPQKDTDLSNHPDDFDLYAIGEFDSSSGVILPYSDGPKLVVQGKQVALSR